ncbi:MAG: LptF/LptG family permease [Nitrospirae bacterium]|nr:LptF/LptG family permease [Nitrospirota bacterium]
MKILTKYFLREYLKFYIICLTGVTAILLVAEFFDKIDEFSSHRTPLLTVFEYLVLQVPKSLMWVSPAASLLSILFTVGMASKWKEIVTIKAASCSRKKMFAPFLVLGVLVSFLVLIFGETIVPMATSRAAFIKNIKIMNKSPRITYKEGSLWIKGLDMSLIRINDFVEDRDKILKISIFNFSPSFSLVKRIEADEAEWVNGKWELRNVTVFDFISKVSMKHKTLVFTALEEPKIFRDEMKKPEEMSFLELHAYYKRLENAGFRNLRYIVALYQKLAYPFVNFVMVLFGLALALNAGAGGGIRAAGLGIVVIIGYWMLFSISLSLGQTGTVPPYISPWLSPVVFAILGYFMFRRIKE